MKNVVRVSLGKYIPILDPFLQSCFFSDTLAIILFGLRKMHDALPVLICRLSLISQCPRGNCVCVCVWRGGGRKEGIIKFVDWNASEWVAGEEEIKDGGRDSSGQQ